MGELREVAGPFVEMAPRIVWATVASVGAGEVPRTRVLHPIWEWDPGADAGAGSLVGWIATGPTPLKLAHLRHSPWISANYWDPSQDNCTAECRATWHFDLETRQRVWSLFADGPEPVGYDPSLIPQWEGPSSEAFAVLRLDPWRLRVFPGTLLLGGEGELLTWRAPA
ncbi:MAG: pyridoxamine 5'-phosphate oxidase family protein [Microthrixaceae bacterium]